jgi:hypothetical protein
MIVELDREGLEDGSIEKGKKGLNQGITIFSTRYTALPWLATIAENLECPQGYGASQASFLRHFGSGLLVS